MTSTNVFAKDSLFIPNEYAHCAFPSTPFASLSASHVISPAGGTSCPPYTNESLAIRYPPSDWVVLT
jgi:hypothetical protein